MRRALPAWLLLVAVVSALSAGTQIVLDDGQVLEGESVQRDGDEE